MLRTTPGRLMIEAALPPDLRDPGRVLDRRGIKDLHDLLARKHPGRYREVSHALLKIGGDIAYAHGGLGFGLRHLRPARSALAIRMRIRRELDAILDDPRLDDAAREAAIVDLGGKYRDELERSVYRESLDEGNPLALQVLSGVRGSEANLRSLRGADLLYTDHRGNTIPIPVLKSYSEGLSPAEYWAGAYGARHGVVATKLCLHANTLVRMADFSVRRICEIMPGDMVLGADRSANTFPVHVSNVFENGLRWCYRHKFRVSQTKRFVELDATEDHNVLARLKFGRTGKNAQRSTYEPTAIPLARGCADYVAVPSGSFSPDIGIDEPRALLLGMMLGDGCMTTRTGGLQFSCFEPELVQVYRRELQKVGCDASSTNVRSWSIRRVSRERCPATLAAKAKHRRPCGPLPNLFMAWLEELGLVGCHSYDKFIPECVWAWNQESIAALIAGLIVTDGAFTVTSTTGVISISLTSRQLIESLISLLEVRFGIRTGSVGTREASMMQWARHDQWSFKINGRASLSRLAAQISVPGRKGRALDAWLARLPPAKNEKIGEFPYQGRVGIGLLPTFDLEVEHEDHLFVLANGLIVSNSVAKSGYLSKQMLQAAHRLLVTARDADAEDESAADRGLPAAVDDPDNEGALLARPAGGYARNTVLTPRILKDLQDQGVPRVLLRSPLVGGPVDGGVYARDVGVREKGRLAPLGDYVGIAAAQALGEKGTQMTLGAKHAGGVAGSRTPSGFQALDRLLNPPKVYTEAAAHAQLDGRVDSIEDAPQGGRYLFVGGRRHHVAGEHEPLVRVGDAVEAGDVLSTGIPNPAEIVRHKGIGEGRRVFVSAFRDLYRNAGLSVHRRNIELLARGLIDRVEMQDEHGPFLPGDVVPYSAIESGWEPRPGAAAVNPGTALGRYLERGVLHHTIGTPVRPSMVKELKDWGVQSVLVHPEPPPFTPLMQPARTLLATDPDWATRQLGFGLEGSLLEAVRRGRAADTAASTSFVPAMLDPETFGKAGPTRGYDPDDLGDDEDDDDDP